MRRKSKRRMPGKRTLHNDPKQYNASGESSIVPKLSPTSRGKSKMCSDLAAVATKVMNESETKGENFSISSKSFACAYADDSVETVADIHEEMVKDSASIETKVDDSAEVKKLIKTHESVVPTDLSIKRAEDVMLLEFLPTKKRLKNDKMEVPTSSNEFVDRAVTDSSLKNETGNQGEVITASKNSLQQNFTCLSEHVEFTKELEFKRIATAAEEEEGRVRDNLAGRLRLCLKDGKGNYESLLKDRDHKQEEVSAGWQSKVHKSSSENRSRKFGKDMREPSCPKLYICALCPYQSSISTNFIRLAKNFSGERPHVCGECCAKFSNKQTLKHDPTKHDNDKPYVCPHCTAKFAVRSTLWMHLKIHVGEKAFSCTLCPAVFKERNELFTHLSMCSSKTQFKCFRCSTKFERKYDLTRHECWNSNEKLFSCPKCPLTFRRAHLLQIHMSSHIICNLISSYQSQGRSQVDIG